MPDRLLRPGGTPPPEPAPAPTTLAQTLRVIGRALRLRCPHCGRGRLFDRWIRLRRRCDVCGLILERGEDDYFIGAYMVNLIIAELMVVAAMVVVLVATWPAVPWAIMLWGIVILTIPAVVFTYPFSRSLWLAIDLVFRPAESRDFAPVADIIDIERPRPPAATPADAEQP